MKLQYLQNLFEDEAKRFSRDKVYNTAHSYDESKMKMIEQYNYFTTQNRMRLYLQYLSLSPLWKKKIVQ